MGIVYKMEREIEAKLTYQLHMIHHLVYTRPGNNLFLFSIFPPEDVTINPTLEKSRYIGTYTHNKTCSRKTIPGNVATTLMVGLGFKIRRSSCLFI